MHIKIQCNQCTVIWYAPVVEVGFCTSTQEGTSICCYECSNCGPITCDLSTEMVNELEEKGIKFVQVELNSANTNEPCISYDDILEFHETLDDEDRSRQWQKDLLDLNDLRKEGARFENWFMRICAEFTGADR